MNDQSLQVIQTSIDEIAASPCVLMIQLLDCAYRSILRSTKVEGVHPLSMNPGWYVPLTGRRAVKEALLAGLPALSNEAAFGIWRERVIVWLVFRGALSDLPPETDRLRVLQRVFDALDRYGGIADRLPVRPMHLEKIIGPDPKDGRRF